MYDLNDKVAIVTGGGTGIGRATSLLLAARGARVAVVFSNSEADARETVATIEAAGGRAIPVKADIASASSIDAMVEAVVAQYGRIDYLVNNAAITRQLVFDDLDAITDDIWDSLLAVNVKGTFNCCKAAAPHLAKNADSAIVIVGSIAGTTGYGSSLPYAVTKAAVHGMTKSLARALAPKIRVNCVAPGAVDTRWWKGNEEKMRVIAGNLPLKRISTAEDVAQVIELLLTAVSMTGQIVLAENGQTL